MANQVSEPQKIFRIGMLGFGTVGAGAAKLILESVPPLKDKTGIELRIHKVAVKDLHKPRLLGLPKSAFTTNAHEIVNDPQVDIVVEVIGGLEPAKALVLQALKHGKAVVTANKALLATHGKELFEAAVAHHTSIGFEASVCGGVPVIGAIRDGLVGNRIESILGILNGTTNYILTRMIEGRTSYAQGLLEAQSHGYAESDPTMDVNGTDAAQKLVLLSDLGFHSTFSFSDVHVEGIAGLDLADVTYAAQLGYTMKLLAIAKRRNPGADPDEVPGGLEMRVHPTLIPFNHPLANVRDVNNAVLVKGDATGEVMFYGRGAGMLPTGSAIVADILDAARGSARQTFTKLQFFQNPRADLPVIHIEKVRSRFYVRFNVLDKPGVMGKLATVLGSHGVSIASVIQKEPQESGNVPIVMLTHNTIEERFRVALEEIKGLEFVKQSCAFYRVED